MKAFLNSVLLSAVVVSLCATAHGATYYGLYKATVVNAVDPQARGRLLLLIPNVDAKAPKRAQPCVPYKASWQSAALPPAHSTVWVEFELGDSEKPVWLGWLPGTGELAGKPLQPAGTKQ
ncbi:MAG: hypothetical protein KGJ79_14880 [Alphaproteobacteria bacterium]|nr:hypothetical protein [Alphaproteobacteria bacterium]